MVRPFLLAALLCAHLAHAAVPDFSAGGVVFSLQYGPGSWFLDGPKLNEQLQNFPFEQGLLTDTTLNGQSATVRLGYNVLGHATVEGTLTATGWNLFDPNRGGAGFGTGVLHWHPLQLVDQLYAPAWMKERAYDASLFVGMGYGILGQTRGLDGLVWQWGADANWYFGKSIGLGLFVRSTQLATTNYYIDFYNRSVAGNTIVLADGGVGSFVQFGVDLTLRFAP